MVVSRRLPQVSLYKSHTTEEPLRRLRSGRYCQVLSSPSDQVGKLLLMLLPPHQRVCVVGAPVGLACTLEAVSSAQPSIAVDLAPVELSPTHCPRADVDVSLKDSHPHHPRQSCPFCLCHPLPYSFFHSSSSFCPGMEKIFQNNKKVVKFS